MVGAPQHSGGGAVYVYGASAGAGGVWTLQQKLFASDPAPGDQFGHAIAIRGDLAAVGAPFKSGSLGAMYLFTRSSNVWTFDEKFTAADSPIQGRFGSAVAIGPGGDLAVGAPSTIGSGSGAFYFFRFVGDAFSQGTRVTAPDAALSDEFGAALALSGDILAVGTRLDDDFGLNSGSVNIFENWVFQDKVTAIGSASSTDQFGTSLALDGSTQLLVGSPNDDPQGVSNAGTVHLFNRVESTWQDQRSWSFTGAVANDNLGWSVAMSGSRALVGAPGRDTYGAGSGSVFFLASSLQPSSILEVAGTAPVNGALMGYSVALQGNAGVMGAPFAGPGHADLIKLGPVCGDSLIEAGEQCDPPNFGTCGADCQFTFCGDGVIQGAESCDPPDGVTCNLACQTIVCGDGIVEGNEQCEPPDGLTCNFDCTLFESEPDPFCGDGQIDEGEECEPPGVGDCNSNCSRISP
jgi:hypothetical protein